MKKWDHLFLKKILHYDSLFYFFPKFLFIKGHHMVACRRFICCHLNHIEVHKNGPLTILEEILKQISPKNTTLLRVIGSININKTHITIKKVI
jgi:hypothetical protein